MWQLVSELKDDLLSLDQQQRSRALQIITYHLDTTTTDNDDTATLDYLFEYGLSKVKAEDCLLDSTALIKMIVSLHPEKDKLLVSHSVLETYSVHDSSVQVRLSVLDILKSFQSAVRVPLLLARVAGEKDPRCLLDIFSLITGTLDITDYVEDVFEHFSPYFPITFKSTFIKSVSEEELQYGLRVVLAAHPEMAHLSLPFYNEKLSLAQNGTVAMECVKGMRASLERGASGSAVSAFHRESINLAVSVLSKDFCDEHLALAVYELLVSFVKNPVVSQESAILISEHCLFGMKDANGKMNSIIPSIVRYVAATSETVSRIFYDSIIKDNMKGIISAESNDGNKLGWACVLAFLCATSESSFHIFRVDCLDVKKLAKIQSTVLSQNSQQPSIRKKDLVFAMSFIEALLRDPLVVDGLCRLDLIKSLLTFVDEYKNSISIDQSFVTMIVQSVIKHQTATILENCKLFTGFSGQIVVESLMGGSEELAIELIDAIIESGESPKFYLESACDDLFTAGPLEKSISWLHVLDQRLDYDSCDIIICSFKDRPWLIENMALFSEPFQRLIALSLPVDLSTVQVLSRFAHDPEIIAALYNKHGQDMPVSLSDNPQSLFALARAMIFLEDERVFAILPTLPQNTLESILDPHTSRVDFKHNFVARPTHKKWFLERVLPDHKVSFECKLALLVRCCLTDKQVIKSLVLEPFIDELLRKETVTLESISFIDSLLTIDPFIIKTQYTGIIDKLIVAGTGIGSARVRAGALMTLIKLLETVSGSAVLPFAGEYIKKVRPALGDRKQAIRGLAVRVTDLLYCVML
jgi:hypothetical protein